MSSAQNQLEPNREQINFFDLLIVLAKNSRMIVLTTLGVTLATYLILFILPNKYTSVARLFPPQQNMTLSGQLLEIMGGGVTPGRASGAGASLSGLASGLLGIKTPSALYLSILVSNTVLDQIIDRFNLRKLYKTRYIEDTRKQLLKMASIQEDRKDGLITIEVTDKDPKRAAAIANAFGEELDKVLRGLTSREAKERLVFLERERVTASVNLKKAEENLRTFSEKNSVIQIDAQAKGALEYIAKLRAEIDAKEVQIKVFRQQATSTNYDVIRLETELKGLQEKLRAAETKWDPSCIGDVCLATSNVPALGLEYIRLYREAKFQEALFQLYCKLSEVARLDEVRDVSAVQFIDTASKPEKRSNKRLLPSVLAGIITFFLMIFVVFFKEFWMEVKKREDVVQRLNMLRSYLNPWKHTFVRTKDFDKS